MQQLKNHQRSIWSHDEHILVCSCSDSLWYLYSLSAIHHGSPASANTISYDQLHIYSLFRLYTTEWDCRLIDCQSWKQYGINASEACKMLYLCPLFFQVSLSIIRYEVSRGLMQCVSTCNTYIIFIYLFNWVYIVYYLHFAIYDCKVKAFFINKSLEHTISQTTTCTKVNEIKMQFHDISCSYSLISHIRKGTLTINYAN